VITGRSGLAITLVTPFDITPFHAVETHIGNFLSYYYVNLWFKLLLVSAASCLALLSEREPDTEPGQWVYNTEKKWAAKWQGKSRSARKIFKSTGRSL